MPTHCQHEYVWDRACGAKVCTQCNHHKDLARCYCGWPNGRGRDELEEMGEVIDDPDDF